MATSSDLNRSLTLRNYLVAVLFAAGFLSRSVVAQPLQITPFGDQTAIYWSPQTPSASTRSVPGTSLFQLLESENLLDWENRARSIVRPGEPVGPVQFFVPHQPGSRFYRLVQYPIREANQQLRRLAPGDEPTWVDFGLEHLAATDPIQVNQGQVTIHCVSPIPWYESDRGFFRYQNLVGAFDVSATVQVRQAADPSQETTSGFRFAGLMIRQAGQGYKFVVVGRRGSYGNQVETKNTSFPNAGPIGYSSPLGYDTPDQTQSSELRLTRDATGLIQAYSRPIGSSGWVERSFSEYHEPALGDFGTESVQVGLVVYGLSGSPNFLGLFNDVSGFEGGTGQPTDPDPDPEPEPGPVTLILDDQSPNVTRSSGWANASAASNHYGPMSLYATVGGSVEELRFAPDLPVAGTYEVAVWNSCYHNRAINVPHRIQHADGETLIPIDQDCDTGSSGEWLSLGQFPFDAGSTGFLEISDEGLTYPYTTYIGADAARFTLIQATDDPDPLPPSNQAPILSIDPVDHAVTLGETLLLSPNVVDDGLPSNTLAMSWQSISGVGTATFGSPNLAETTVQFQVEGSYLLELLVTDGALTSSAQVSVTVSPISLPVPSVPEVILVNGDAGTSAVGSWNAATSATNHYASMSLYASAGGVTDRYQFTPSLPESGYYDVFAWNACYQNRPANVPHHVVHAEGETIVTIDQACDTGSSGEWTLIGRFPFVVGEEGWLEISDQGLSPATTTYIGADAARFLWAAPYVESAPPVVTVEPTTAELAISDSLALSAAVTDLDADPSEINLSWSKVSGPGEVTFSDAQSLATVATFDQVGSYVIELIASDGILSDSAAISVEVITGVIEIIIDDSDATAVASGNWGNATAASQHFGNMSRYAVVGGSVDTYRFTPNLPLAGQYRVSAWNSCYGNRATAVPHRVAHLGGETVIEVDQDCDTGVSGAWLELGVFQFGTGSSGYVEISDAGLAVPFTTYIGADAVRFELVL